MNRVEGPLSIQKAILTKPVSVVFGGLIHQNDQTPSPNRGLRENRFAEKSPRVMKEISRKPPSAKNFARKMAWQENWRMERADASRNTEPKITPKTLTIDLASAKGNQTNFGLVYALARRRTRSEPRFQR